RELDFQPEALCEVVDVALRFVSTDGTGLQARPEEPGNHTLPPLPPSWATTTDHLRPARPRGTPVWEWRKQALPAVSFTPEQTVAGDRVHLHLAHPVVHRLLSRFLAQGFAAHDLSRVTAVTTRHTARTYVIAYARLSMFGAGATRLHDRVLSVVARGAEGELCVLNPTDDGHRIGEVSAWLKEALLAATPPAPELQARLVNRAASDYRELWPRLESESEAEVFKARRALDDRGASEAAMLARLITGHLQQLNDELGGKQQSLGQQSKAEQRQREAYRRYMHQRRETLQVEQRHEPRQLIESYQVATHRLEPLGLCYLVGGMP
ncbi:MAG: hypothetical protein ACPG4T_20165, partial [Nannocystaceae bacterium]